MRKARRAGRKPPAGPSRPARRTRRAGQDQVPPAGGTSFNAALAALDAFVRREGHVLVPVWHVEQGVRLGQWVVMIRGLYRHGQLSPDESERIARVSGWSWEPEPEWFVRGLAALRAFVAREGHTRVPDGHVEQGVALGDWVRRLRKALEEGRLPEARRAQLDAAVPGWDRRPRAERFEDGLRLLRAFVERHGHSQVRDHSRWGGPDVWLASWVKRQRLHYRAGRLAPERITALEAVRGWTWETSTTKRSRSAVALAAHQARLRRLKGLP